MKSKTVLNGLLGMIGVSGLLLLGCETETLMQLFFAVVSGFGFMAVAGFGLIINNRVK